MASTITTTAGALQTLCNVTRTSDARLAGVLGCTRQGAYGKRTGKIPLHMNDFDRLMEFFQIPPEVLFMNRSEILTWMGGSGWSDQPGRVSPWIHVAAA